MRLSAGGPSVRWSSHEPRRISTYLYVSSSFHGKAYSLYYQAPLIQPLFTLRRWYLGGPSVTIAERSGEPTAGLRGRKAGTDDATVVLDLRHGNGNSGRILPGKPRRGRSGGGEARVPSCNNPAPAPSEEQTEASSAINIERGLSSNQGGGHGKTDHRD
jgi:hypothetical protein